MTGPRARRAAARAFALALASAAALSGGELDEIRGQAHRQAAQRVAGAVVRIETTGGLERVEGVFTGSGPTTGLVVRSDGWIVSSAFALAKRPTGILVHAEGRPPLPARVVGTDYSRMISLLKVEADGLPTPEAVPKGAIRPGQTAIALGRTFRQGPPSMSVGIVSAVGRVWGKAVQTDAKTSPHNYGGPLVDLDGRVFGVIVPLDPEEESPVAGARWYDSGVGFAIPLEDVLASLERLQQGDRRPGLLGAQFRSADPFVRPTVERAWWRSPAALAGLERGDRIAAVDGRSVDRLNDLRQVLGNKYAGDRVRLEWDRGGARAGAEVELVAELPKYRWPMLGVLAEESDGGLRVTRVVAGSRAADAGLVPGCVLVRIDEAAAHSLEAARGAIDRRAPKEGVRIAWMDGEQKREAALAVVAFPDPPDPPADAPGEAEVAGDAAIEELRLGSTVVRGRFPKDAARPGLVVYLAGAKSPSAEEVAADWKRPCDEHHLALLVLSPKSGGVWRTRDLSAAGETLKRAVEEWGVDPRRIVVHGVGETSSVAAAIARSNRGLVRGALLVGAANAAGFGPTDPNEKLAFAWYFDARDLRRPRIEAVQGALRDLGYPVFAREAQLTARSYLPAPQIRQAAAWIDLLAAL